jgi:predicted metal-dependent HD superfamily phosphohydrolase
MARSVCAGPARVPDVERLLDAWGQAGRAYHNRDHLSAVLAVFDRHRELAARPDLVEMALWYHDAVYDPRRADNEEASAEWAVRDLKAAGFSPDDVLAVKGMILATRHRGHETFDGDTRLLLDIDLSVLAGSPEAFDTYEAAIRQEYKHVAEDVFREKRAEVLQQFVARERIYHVICEMEGPARENLARSMGNLAVGEKTVVTG